jgi:hypothetical protein
MGKIMPVKEVILFLSQTPPWIQFYSSFPTFYSNFYFVFLLGGILDLTSCGVAIDM